MDRAWLDVLRPLLDELVALIEFYERTEIRWRAHARAYAEHQRAARAKTRHPQRREHPGGEGPDGAGSARPAPQPGSARPAPQPGSARPDLALRARPARRPPPQRRGTSGADPVRPPPAPPPAVLEETRRRIRSLFRRLVRVVHPDKGGDDVSFRSVMEAFKSGNLLRLLVSARRNSVDLGGCARPGDVARVRAEIRAVQYHIERLRQTRAWFWGEARATAAADAAAGAGAGAAPLPHTHT